MKILINKKNHKYLYGKIKDNKPEQVSITVGDNFFSSSKAILSLKKAADFCIQNDIGLKIHGIPLCFLLGYRKYLVFSSKKNLFLKSKKCNQCLLFKECPGFLKNNYIDMEAMIKPINRRLTDLEACMLKILKIKNNISTEEVLKLAKRIKICASCTSEGEVLRVTQKLIEAGLIKNELKDGKYVWSKI
jgi:hypothetical protein